MNSFTKYAFLLGIISSFMMCSNNDGNNTDKTILSETFVSDTSNKYKEATRLVNDSFISNVLDNDAVLKKLKLAYGNRIKYNIKPINNRFVSGQKDTIYSFYENKDTVRFYLTANKEIPIKIVVNTPNVIFDKDIKVGITKEYFKNRFNVPKVTDLFFIQDLEGGCVMKFEFKNNILLKITLTGNID